MTALTRKQLDLMGCSTPGCECREGPMMINSKCHPGQPVFAGYDAEEGVLVLTCSIDSQFVAKVAVNA